MTSEQQMTEQQRAALTAEFLAGVEAAIAPDSPADRAARLRQLMPATIEGRLEIVAEFLRIAAKCPPRPIGTTPAFNVARRRRADFDDDRVREKLDWLEATLGGYDDLQARYPDPMTPERAAHTDRLVAIWGRLEGLPLTSDESLWLNVMFTGATCAPLIPPLVAPASPAPTP
ncbi:MAG: hypothetical protein IT450_20645 [Phycisphaerales bacterium]|nr:hypothetical protein [Phycisphaerales bacterium]